MHNVQVEDYDNVAKIAIGEFPSLEHLPIAITQKWLDGSMGTNRANYKSCQLRAHNDYEAVHCWLDEYKQTETTYRVYRREAERLLLWCVYQQHKPLSSLDREDLEIYFQFLLNPEPREIWCATRGGYNKKRGAPGWRPFATGLSYKSQQNVISILYSLFDYLTVGRYLSFNPLSLRRRQRAHAQTAERRKLAVMDRTLEIDEWHALLDTLDEMSEGDASNTHKKDDKERLRLLVYMLYFLGLRISELGKSTWNAVREIQGKWWFIVEGKGGKIGKVPVHQELLEAMKKYRIQMGMETELPGQEDIGPIIVSWNSGEALTARYMNKLLKRLAIQAAEKFIDQPKKAEKLHKFSAHWLRHFSATMQNRAGIRFEHIRANHRHENDNTTRIYVHTFDELRHDDMQKMSLRENENIVADEEE